MSARTIARTSGASAFRQALKLLWSAADDYSKRRLLLVLALMAVTALLTAMTPLALKYAIDSFATGQKATQFAGPVALVALYVCGLFVTRLLSDARFLVHGHLQGRICHRIGLRLFDHLMRLPMRFHVERQTGAMGQISQQATDGLEQLLHNMLYAVLPVTLEFIAVAVVLLHFGYPLYLGILVAAAIAYMFTFRAGATDVQEPSHEMAAARVDAHATLSDSLINYEAIKYFDAERTVSRQYDGVLARVEGAWRKTIRQMVGNGVWISIIFALSLGSSLIFAAHDVSRGAMTVGDFVLVNSYIMRFLQPLEMLGVAVREVARALASMQKTFELFSQETELDSASMQSAPVGQGELTFDSVSFRYADEREILRDLDLHVPAGRTVAIVGVSGSGKSSMIRLLFRLYEPAQGRILLDGVPISQLPLSTVRQAIAVVPQDTVLFHDSIANNIAFGRAGATRAEIEEAARVASLRDFIARLPQGYDTIVGERGLKLSGGERQRIAIARAALKRPRIFVFDEATSSLDSRTEQEILRNLHDVARTRTTLVIAHRLSTVIRADEIVVLHKGCIVERGTHASLMEREGHYAALWRAQQGAISSAAPIPQRK